MTDWVSETVAEIENSEMEEKYFCKECGFEVIFPVEAKIHRCECCNSVTGVGFKNHLPVLIGKLDGTIVEDQNSTMCCPFHPGVMLTTTAVHREKKGMTYG